MEPRRDVNRRKEVPTWVGGRRRRGAQAPERWSWPADCCAGAMGMVVQVRDVEMEQRCWVA
jgi:hypothetical protein